MSFGSSAREMIQRMRGPPTSKAERTMKIKRGEVNELWWMDDGFGSDRVSHSDVSETVESFDRLLNGNSTGISRKLNPKIQLQSSTQYKSNRTNDELESIESMIAKDIMKLENEFRSTERLSSIEPPNRRTYRSSLDQLLGNVNTSNSYGLGYSKIFDEPFRSSLDVLGGTHGLTVGDLKLDGVVPKPPDPPAPLPATTELYASLDELLKALGGGKPLEPLSEDPPAPGDLDLPDIPLRLEAELKAFNAYYERKHAQEEAAEKAVKDREAQLLAEGAAKEKEARMAALENLDPAMDTGVDLVSLLAEMDRVAADGVEESKGGDPPAQVPWTGLSLDDAMKLSKEFRGYVGLVGGTESRQSDVTNATLRYMKLLRHRLGLRQQRLDGLFVAATATSAGEPPLGPPEEKADLPDNWNPYPDLVRHNIFTTDKSIVSALDSAMAALHLRLPEADERIAQEKKLKDECADTALEMQRREHLTLQAAHNSLDSLLNDLKKRLADKDIEQRDRLEMSNDLDGARSSALTTSASADDRPLSPPPSYSLETIVESPRQPAAEAALEPEPQPLPAAEEPAPLPPVPLKDEIAALDKVLGAADPPPGPIIGKKATTAKDVGLPDLDRTKIEQYIDKMAYLEHKGALAPPVPVTVVQRNTNGPSAPSEPYRIPAVPELKPAPLQMPPSRVPIEGQSMRVYRQAATQYDSPELIHVSTSRTRLPPYGVSDDRWSSAMRTQPRPSPVSSIQRILSVPSAPSEPYRIPAIPELIPTQVPIEGQSMRVYRQAATQYDSPELIHVSTSRTRLPPYGVSDDRWSSAMRTQPKASTGNEVPHAVSNIHDRAAYLMKMQALRGKY